MFSLFAARCEMASTIITSNHPFSEWVGQLHGKALTVALPDRITHRAIVQNMKGTSFRRK
ncbi:MAG: ATP-binding protein [Methanomicrobiales archaeon]|nr:ATP-binding protein [Methanomicrobiales archaeon]